MLTRSQAHISKTVTGTTEAMVTLAADWIDSYCRLLTADCRLEEAVSIQRSAVSRKKIGPLCPAGWGLSADG
jgi:hypothetical protein